LLGEPIPRRAREARVRLGVVPQADNLDPDFTVVENLLVYGRYFGLPDATIHERIPLLLEFAGLESRAGLRIQALSGGMKRRLSLARALINDPDLMFLDEPTTGLDPQARHLIWERLKQLVARGKTILLTTHFMDEAQRLCDRIGVMDRGRLICTGSPAQLVAQHIEPQVVEIYGEGAVQWAQRCGEQLCRRCERAGETVFCYTHDGEPALRTLAGREDLRYLHRPANLEDVFLKLTGRDLRD
jgi:lipooligosaccharide transport system ATP-binding protein